MITSLRSVAIGHSLFRPESLKCALQERFPIGPINEVIFHRSFINDTYCVKAVDRIFYFRVYQANWRSSGQVASEMAIIEALARAGAPVARPVALPDGDFVVEMVAPEAVRPAVLIAEAPGSELTYTDDDGRDNAWLYGVACARLHGASASIRSVRDRPAMDTHTYVSRPIEILSELLTDLPMRRELSRIGMRLLSYVEKATGLTIGFAHGDLNGSNIQFRGESPTIIDFDCCGWGWRANDIAAFIRGVTLTERPGERASALISAYLSGYRTQLEISLADLAALPTFLLIQRTWMTSLHVSGRDRWGAAYFGLPYVERLVAWLSVWEHILDDTPQWCA